MKKTRYTPEQIIGKLREAEVVLAKGGNVGQVSKQFGVTEQTLGDEVLKREIVYTLEEAKFIIEQWRKEYNQIRPHSSLGYRSPTPETVVPWMVPAGGADSSGLTYVVVQYPGASHRCICKKPSSADQLPVIVSLLMVFLSVIKQLNFYLVIQYITYPTDSWRKGRGSPHDIYRG